MGHSADVARIAAALGLDPSRVRSLSLNIAIGEVATLVVESVVYDTAADALVSVLETYTLTKDGPE